MDQTKSLPLWAMYQLQSHEWLSLQFHLVSLIRHSFVVVLWVSDLSLGFYLCGSFSLSLEGLSLVFHRAVNSGNRSTRAETKSILVLSRAIAKLAEDRL